MDGLDAAARLLIGEVLGEGLSPDVADLLAGRLADSARGMVEASETAGASLARALVLLGELLEAQAAAGEHHAPPQSITAVTITIMAHEAMRLYALWQKARVFKYEHLLREEWGDVWDELPPAPALVPIDA